MTFIYNVKYLGKMNKSNIISISFVIAVASILAFTSPTLANISIYAQSGSEDGGDTPEGSGDYEEFVNCLAQSEGDKGFASEDEIRDCFRPIYDPQSDANSVASDDSNEDSDSSDNSGTSGSNDDDLAPNAN